eukprot:TRINITY_DN1550_c0_g2_i1.p1 TRINITY_DN1550_c0_g2~~TRINITY_DN1550_c0_g2_i1.p1  ORF type:complete len:150 (+),score=61.91 TRINITY_DN1550_c0_g2_i1:54-452(+)
MADGGAQAEPERPVEEARALTAEPFTDIASLFDDPEAGAAAVESAQRPPAPSSVHALPLKAYLENTVVPILLQGLDALAQARLDPATAPEDPQEWLAAYLFKNNPQKSADKLAAARVAREAAGRQPTPASHT